MFSNVTLFQKRRSGIAVGSVQSSLHPFFLYFEQQALWAAWGRHGHLKTSPCMLVWDPFRRHLKCTISLKREGQTTDLRLGFTLGNLLSRLEELVLLYRSF